MYNTAATYCSIVAGGERAALPHVPPMKWLIGGEILVLVDWVSQ